MAALITRYRIGPSRFPTARGPTFRFRPPCSSSIALAAISPSLRLLDKPGRPDIPRSLQAARRNQAISAHGDYGRPRCPESFPLAVSFLMSIRTAKVHRFLRPGSDRKDNAGLAYFVQVVGYLIMKEDRHHRDLSHGYPLHSSHASSV